MQPTDVEHDFVLSLLAVDPRRYGAASPSSEDDEDDAALAILPSPDGAASPHLHEGPGTSAPPPPAPTGSKAAAPPPPPKPAASAQDEADKKAAIAAVTDWNKRLKAITITFEIAAATKAFYAAVAPFNAATKAKNFGEAVKHVAAAETALKALEAAAKAVDLPKKQKAAVDAADKVAKMSDADIAKIKPADKAAMIKEMLGAGKPTGAVREAQRKLYRDTDLDPAFRKVDKERQQKVADAFKGDKEIAEARKNWGTASEDDIKKALTKIVAAQSKVLGIPPPEIVTFTKAKDATGVEEGYFDPSDGKLHLNVHADSSIHDFAEAIDTVLHENAHNYQHQLVAQLQAGTLKAGDPLYDQALLFEANELAPGGYIEPAEDQATYEKQPMERHSWETGAATARKVIDVIKAPRRTP